MAVSRDTSGLRSGVNIDGPARSSLTNGSSARKYTSKDIVRNNDVSVPARSNSEYIINQAAGLKSTGVVALQAASVALSQLQAIRNSLQGINPSNDQSSLKNPIFDDQDLKVAQDGYFQDIVNQLGTYPVASVQRRLEDHTYDLITNSVSNFLPVSQKGQGNAVNPATPEIDYISVDMHTNKGTFDIFYATITFSLPKSAVATGKLKAVRIFRALVDNPDFFNRQPARLSVQAVERLCSQPLRSKRKNQDYLGQYELQLADMDVDNALSALNPTDPLVGLRREASKDRVTATDHLSARDQNTHQTRQSADLQSFVQPQSFTNLDPSVTNDLNSLRNLQLQNPHLLPPGVDQSVAVGAAAIVSNSDRLGKQALRQNRENFAQSQNEFLIDKANKPDFKEIAFISPDKLTGRLIGDSVEYTYEDYGIHYSKSYRFYVVTVDENMVESQRSQIVQINVDGLRVPQAPTAGSGYVINNAVCLNVQVDDLLVEKFEIYRKTLTGKGEAETAVVQVLNGSQGYHISDETRPRLPNGFLQIGEATNRANVGGVFYDRETKPGNKYVYRVFSVDIFGNKSESPNEFQVFWPSSQKHVDLATPHILSEIDALTNRVKLTFGCEDSRVTRLFLARRDVSIGQSAFVPPGQVERLKFGRTYAGRGISRFDDVRFGYDSDKTLLWNGVFENTQQNIVFLDKAVMVEHTYQYQIYGMDRFGNSTPIAITPRLFVANAAVLYEPKNVQGQVVPAGPDVSGIQLTWDDSNIDISAEDRVGNREDLRETAVRTLYQVSRRKVGEDQWYDFPMVEQTSFFDVAAPSTIVINTPPPPPQSAPPGYAEQSFLRTLGTQLSSSVSSPLSPLPQQPPQVVANQTYVYRVQSFQSGNFVSNYSDQVVVAAVVPVLTPLNLRCRPCDSKVRPFYIAVNWDTDANSGVVDRWEIERAVVNNVAAAKLNSLNPDDFASLLDQYVPFRTVYSESSRFQERTDDDMHAAGTLVNGASSLLTGQHYYVDQDINFGNTYFYRIRAVAVSAGQTSDWAYRAVKVTDATYEKKQDAVLTPADKVMLSTTPQPIAVKTNFLSPQSVQPPTNLTTRSIPPRPSPPYRPIPAPVPGRHPIGKLVNFNFRNF